MRALAGVIGAVVSAALLAWPSAAQACGGFFCNNVPIDQSGEEIIFDIQNGKVEAHVSISYQGEAKDFSWVIPVHGVPTLKVGAPQFFQYVRNATQPTFQLQYDEGGTCNAFWKFGPQYEAAADAGGTPTSNGVQVLSEGQVGPYDSAVVAADDNAALAKWLSDNGYTLADPNVLEPYVGQGFNFLALKLQQNKTVGELRPVVISFGGDPLMAMGDPAFAAARFDELDLLVSLDCRMTATGQMADYVIATSQPFERHEISIPGDSAYPSAKDSGCPLTK